MNSYGGEINNMNLIMSYLKQHGKSIGAYAVFSLLFAAVFSLYNLPVEAVVYAVVLCTGFGSIFVIMDFRNFYKRHKLLTELKNHITLATGELPLPKDLLESDYQELIRTISQEKTELVSKADQVRSELIEYYTMWVHQIKTPISAMSLLLQSVENEENGDLLTELFKIEQYVEMLLQYLRFNSTSTDYVLKNYSLDDIVRQAVRKYAKIFIRKKISLDYNGLNCEVLTDEKWLTFVIEQILSNALKYTSEGKISIYMEQDSGKTLVIEDTGIGIAPEDKPRVFEKGFTGYNGRADKKSTGIGLYLCKRIITKLSHSIAIESTVGQGTKVTIGLDTVNISVE
jgi:signal transduction histidine kinase